MSRLDRFLLSEEWCLSWPNCKQVAKLRGLSDHCPLVLSANEEDWGPRPLRMLKCWKDIPGYKAFVREKWNSFQVDGWGGYVLKEKLKMIKVALRDWHLAHAQNIPSRIDSLKFRLSALDEKGEEDDLSEAELAEFHGVLYDIHSLSKLHASISWQQSRSLWLKEGDANSKYFHSVLASRRRRNTISVIQVDGVTLEGVSPIRQAMFSHFESLFKASNVERPGVDDLQFKRLTQVEEFGGLGVRQLREFNLALLGKWCWRMLVDREGLWFRVLTARYGFEEGRLCEGGQRGSVWWREIARIREGEGELGGRWFREHVVRRVRDGTDTLFWTDPWLDGISLRERFGRLFVLAETKSCSVAEMFALGWGADGEAWVWRRRLRAWEEELLRECQFLLLDISLQDQTSDSWQWSPDPDAGYTVAGGYQILTHQTSVALHDAENLIWHPQVPLKVSIFA
ncbi:unnamed protein product [Trifolium pratense]|uniref:Uncharacterized protein n=1 Tax=Trifolium pratense TaxID=57577 RepID=A0ACB0JI69_TRIPR|nr:unnamed protein product [Trifolium pratense]